MKTIRLPLAFALVWFVQSGTAYANDDYLDKLRGPGGFNGIIVAYRFLCVTTLPDAPDTRHVALLSPVDRGSQLVPLNGPADPRNLKSPRDYCQSDQRVHSYQTVTVGGYWSRKNHLYEGDPQSKFHQVRIFRLTWEYAVRLNQALDVGIGAGWGRFSGDAFDTFDRPFLTPASVKFMPFALGGDGDTAKRRAFSIAAAVTWFGTFDQNDFCGRERSCAEIKNYSSKWEAVPRLTFSVDPVLFLR